MSNHDQEDTNVLTIEDIDPSNAETILASINKALENRVGLNAVDQEALVKMAAIAEAAVIQAAIEAGNIDALENIETAAGDAGTDGGFSTVTLNRDGSETLASSSFSTDAFALTTASNTIDETILSEINIDPTLLIEGGTIDEDAGSITIPYVAEDIDGFIVSTIATVSAEQGSVIVNESDSTITFTPATNFYGDAIITLVTTDNLGGTATTNSIITVNNVNDAPTIIADNGSMDEDNGSVTVAFTAADIDGFIVSTVATVPAAQGSVVVNANNTYTFTPAVNFNGNATVTLLTTDDDGATATTTSTVIVGDVNDAPTIIADNGSMDEDSGSVTVAFTAADIDGFIVSTVATVPATQGSVVVNDDNTYTFTPAANFNGNATVTLLTTDNDGGTGTTESTIMVNPIDDIVYAVISGPGATVEGALTDDFTVKLVNSAGDDVVASSATDVTVMFSNGSAEVGDYVATTQVVTIAAGSAAQTFSVQTLEDVDFDDETFTASISDVVDTGEFELLTWTSAPIGFANSVEATINDNDLVAIYHSFNEDTLGIGDLSDELTIATFSIDGDATIYNVGEGDKAIIVNKGEITINGDGSYVFVPFENYAGDIPAITYTATTGESGILYLSITPVADTLETTIDLEVGIGSPFVISGTNISEIIKDVNGTRIEFSDGTVATSSDDINFSNGLGIGVDSGNGAGDKNRIDVGESITFDFVLNMRSVFMDVKNTLQEVIEIKGEGIDISITDDGVDKTVDMLSGTIARPDGGNDFTELTLLTTARLVLYSDGEFLAEVDATIALIDGKYVWETAAYVIPSEYADSLITADIFLQIDGDIFNNGGDQVAIEFSEGIDKLTFSNDGGKDGYQINELAFGVAGIGYYTYPLTLNAPLVDGDMSENITEVYLDSFPAGSSIIVVHENENGSFTETTIEGTANADGNLVFVLDVSDFIDGGIFKDQIYLTTPEELPANFEPTVAIKNTDIVVIDGVEVEDVSYTILGGSDDAQFTGSDGGDYINGGLGNDTIIAGLGDDTILGGVGNDLLNGGEGIDTFSWLAGDAAHADGIDDYTDTIIDYELESDILDLSDLLDGETANNIDSYLGFELVGNDTVITIDTDGLGGFGDIQTVILSEINIYATDIQIMISGIDNTELYGIGVDSDSSEILMTLIPLEEIII